MECVLCLNRGRVHFVPRAEAEARADRSEKKERTADAQMPETRRPS